MSFEIPDDPARYFHEFFPARFREYRDRYPAGDTAAPAAYEMPDGRAWSFAITGGELTIEDGKRDDVALTIQASDDDFRMLFVERAREDLRKRGGLTELTKDALKPFFIDERKRSICESATESLRLRLAHAGARGHLLVTPGAHPPTRPRATVRLKLDDFLGMQCGKRNATTLFMMRKLKLEGDVAYALKLNGLLA